MNGTKTTVVAVAMLMAAGCEISKQGEAGRVTFTPTDCGGYSLGCSFEDTLVVGGTIGVSMDDASLTLTSADETVASVRSANAAAGSPWEVVGVGGGVARLEARNAAGNVVDGLDVTTKAATQLRLYPLLATSSLSTQDGETAVWTLEAETSQSFLIGPDVVEQQHTMGRFEYEWETTDAALKTALEAQETCGVVDGCIAFDLPPGTYPLTITAGELSASIRFDLQ